MDPYLVKTLFHIDVFAFAGMLFSFASMVIVTSAWYRIRSIQKRLLVPGKAPGDPREGISDPP